MRWGSRPRLGIASLLGPGRGAGSALLERGLALVVPQVARTRMLALTAMAFGYTTFSASGAAPAGQQKQPLGALRHCLSAAEGLLVCRKSACTEFYYLLSFFSLT